LFVRAVKGNRRRRKFLLNTRIGRDIVHGRLSTYIDLKVRGSGLRLRLQLWIGNWRGSACGFSSNPVTLFSLSTVSLSMRRQFVVYCERRQCRINVKHTDLQRQSTASNCGDADDLFKIIWQSHIAATQSPWHSPYTLYNGLVHVSSKSVKVLILVGDIDLHITPGSLGPTNLPPDGISIVRASSWLLWTVVELLLLLCSALCDMQHAAGRRGGGARHVGLQQRH